MKQRERVPRGRGRRLASEGEPELSRDYSVLELLRRPGVGFDDAWHWAGEERGALRGSLRAELGRALADQAIEQLEIATRYAGYIDKQQEQIARSQRAESTRLPGELDYAEVRALSHEARQVLSRHRPETLGIASRLPGVTPASISLLMVHLKKTRRIDPAANDDDALRVSA